MITIFCEKIVKTAISLRAWCKVVQDLYQAAETGLILREAKYMTIK